MLSGRCGVGTVGVGEVLLGQHLIQRGALDHGIGTVLDQVRDQEIGDSLSNIDVVSEDGGGAGLYGGVVEVQNCDPWFMLRSGLAGCLPLHTPSGERRENKEN